MMLERKESGDDGQGKEEEDKGKGMREKGISHDRALVSTGPVIRIAKQHPLPRDRFCTT
jgi:hypothetical protein